MLCGLLVSTTPVDAQQPNDCAERGGTATCTRAELTPWNYNYCELPVLARYARECEALDGGTWDPVEGCSNTNPASSDAEYHARIEDYHLWQGRRCDVGVAEIDWAEDGDQAGTPACWTGSKDYINGELVFHLGSVRIAEFEVDNQGQCVRNESRDHTDWVLKDRSPVCPVGSEIVTLPADEVVCRRITESECRGNPVGVLNGCKIETVTDVAQPDGLNFSRRYESHGFAFRPVNDPASAIPSGMGDYWRHNFAIELIPTPSSSFTLAAVQRANGKVWYFDKSGEQSAPVHGVGARLKAKSNGDWILTTADGHRERFDSTGRLRSVKGPGTPKRELTWSTAQTPANVAPGPGYLLTVTSIFGHRISIRYNDNGLIKRVTDSSGVLHQYFWDVDRRLVAVKAAGLIRYQYHYENEQFPQALTGVTDGEGNRFSTFEYDSAGKAIASSRADTGLGPQEETRFQRTGRDVSVLTPGGRENVSFSDGYADPRITRRENVVDGSVWRYDYDASQNLIDVFDPENNRTSMSYNDIGQMDSLTEAANTSVQRTTAFSYLAPDSSVLASIQRSSVVASQQQIIKRHYDANLNKIRETHRGFASDASAQKRVTRYSFDNFNRKIKVDGPRTDVNDVRHFTWHECADAGRCGQLASSTDAAGNTTRYTGYDASGRLTQMIDPNGLQTRHEYDASGRVVRTTKITASGVSRVRTFAYDANGKLVSATDPVGNQELYFYDNAQMLNAKRDGLGNTIEYDYDRRGNLSAETVLNVDGAVESVVEFDYDAQDQIRTISRGGIEETIDSNTLGQVRSEINGRSIVSARYGYDALGRLRTFEDALGGVAQFSYDVNDSVSLVTAANGARTVFDWDDLGNMREEQSADRGDIAFAYDSAGNLTQRTDARGSQTGFRWDAMNRIVGIRYDSSRFDVNVSWDNCKNGAGRLCGYSDESGSTALAYNQFGNTISTTWNDGVRNYRTRYKWFDNDAVKSIQYPGGRKVKYLRDSAGRVTSMELHVPGAIVPLASDRVLRVDGKVVSQTLSAGLRERRQYDSRGQLVNHTLENLESRNYRYDANGNVTGWVDAGRGRDYSYSAADQLIGEAGSGSLLAEQRDYAYDANSNQIQRIDGTGSDQRSIVAGSNRMSTNGPNSFDSDASGNRIVDTRLNVNLAWDDRGRLRRVRSGGQTLAIYAYNARGQRTSKSLKTADGTVTRQFHYDILGRLIAESVNGEFVREYYWDDTEIVAQMNPQTGVASLRWLVSGPAGAARLAVDSQGQATWRWEPDGFGNGAVETSSTAADDAVYVRLDGQYMDEETGFHYNWHRYYDPVTARYLSVDPLGLAGGLNPFNYAAANPVTLSDPTGLEIPLGNFGVTDGFNKACGSGEIAGKVPDGFLIYNFGPACERHDRCYETCGEDRSACDRRFLDDLKLACGARQMVPNQACKAVARIYGFVTRQKGEQYYRAAQNASRCNECE